MSEFTYTYSKKRKEFGRQVDFHPYDPDLLCESAPNPNLREMYVEMDPYETEIQNIPVMSESQTNTERISLRNRGMEHTEGGWPNAVDATEVEEKNKYCKKQERESNYYPACKALISGLMDENLKQNNAIDIYGEYFANSDGIINQDAAPTLGPPSMKAITVFKDPNAIKRTAAALSWLNDGKRLAVAYCNLKFQGTVEGTSTHSYIWDVQNPNQPLETLNPASPLTSIEFYNKDPHLIAGGSYNGVVQYWDTRQPSRPASRSAIEESHKDPVWAIKWLQSKSGELLSVSTDGQAFIWDCRTPEKPVEIKKLDADTMLMQPKSNEGGAKGVLGGLCLDYDPQVGGPSKYMIGTEQGTILGCNRKGKTPSEKISHTYNAHHGPVYAIQRNPHHPKYFLSIGDWTARLWYEDFKITPMYSSFYHRCHLTSGCWHPQRAGVFFTTRMDGCLDAWDLLNRQSTAVASLQVSDYALHSIRSTTEGRHVAVGAVDGSVTLVELSPSLYTPMANEKNSVGKMFDNESSRDKNLDKAAKEKKTQQRKQRQSQTGGEAASGVDDGVLQGLADNYLGEVHKLQSTEEQSLDDLVKRRAKLMDDLAEGLELEAN